MNSIQNYVLESLFERNQITKEKLAQALDTFSNEPAIDAFLSVLITGKSETKKPNEIREPIHVKSESNKVLQQSSLSINTTSSW